MAKFNLAELVVKFTGDTSGLEKSIAGAEKSTNAFGLRLARIGTAAAAAASAVGLVYRAEAQLIDKNDDLAKSLGISYGALQELSYVARFSGVDINQLSSALGLMQRAIIDASNGSDAALAPFERLGISIKDILNLTPDQQFAAIAEKISSIQNPAERTALAMDIFGRSGRALNDVFTDFNSKAADAKRFTEAFGLSMSQLDVEKVTQANDEWEKLGLAISGIAQIMTVTLAPAAGAVGKALVEAAAAALRQWGELRHLLSTIGRTIDANEAKVRAKYGIPDPAKGASSVDPSGGFPYGVIYGSEKPITSTGTFSTSVTSDSFSAPLRVAKQGADQLIESQKQIVIQNDKIANSAADAFADFVSSIGHGKNALESLRSTALRVIGDIVSNMFRLSFGGQGDNTFAGGIASSLFGALGIGGAAASFARTSLRGLANPSLFGPGFADGGVVQRATMFPIGANTGMMGEKGPEAIMPLTRIGGKLGVAATGGGGTNVTQNISFTTGVNQTVREEVLRLMPQIEMAAVSGVKKAQNRGAL